jgi:hypothetical protein
MAWAVPSAAAAEAEFEIGGRLGLGIPIGDVAGGEGEVGGEPLNDSIAVQFPLILDVGARINGRIFVGGYLGFGLGVPGNDVADWCDETDDEAGVEASCVAYVLRLGAQAHYHFQDRGRADPWVGAGIGYEWAGYGMSAESGSQDVDLSFTAHGLEFVNLQGGVDFALSELLTIGPFATFTLGRYGRLESDCSGACSGFDDLEEEIDEKAIHGWLMVGGRVSFFP